MQYPGWRGGRVPFDVCRHAGGSPTERAADAGTVAGDDGEPVYLVAQRYGISEWNILNGMDEIVLAYDEPVVGMKAVIPGIKFINRRVLGVGSYGEDWFAYRRPPEGEEDT